MKKSNRLSTKNSMANRARRRQTFIKSCKDGADTAGACVDAVSGAEAPQIVTHVPAYVYIGKDARVCRRLVFCARDQVFCLSDYEPDHLRRGYFYFFKKIK